MSRAALATRSRDRTQHLTIDVWFVVALARTIRKREVVFHAADPLGVRRQKSAPAELARPGTPDGGTCCACCA